MADQLPIITRTRAINIRENGATSLIGRGLIAIKPKETVLAVNELDVRYRQARNSYNRITLYGSEKYFKADAPKMFSELFEDKELFQLHPFFNLLKELENTFKVFQQMADIGYGKAYLPLSIMYQGGQAISQNIQKSDYYSQLAFEWCYENQELNDPEIWTDLGYMYAVEYEDYEQAMVCYQLAAEQNHAYAQTMLADIYADVYSEEQDDERAKFWYLKAAKLGHAEAQYNLGVIYSHEGEEHNLKQSLFWYLKAAEHGHAKAQCDLGQMYDHNDEEWLYIKGLGLEHDCKQAIFWYRKAAEQGYSFAQFKLGGIHINNCPCEEHEGEQAIFWFRIADGLRFGSGSGLFNIGWMYENGRRVQQDIKQAIFWYRKAAEQNYARAQEYLTKLGINWKDS